MADNVNYVVYAHTGDILRYGLCPGSENLHKMANPLDEEYVIEGVGNDMTHVVKDFKVVELATPKTRKKTVDQQRLETYPLIATYIDAQVKIHSGDDDMVKEGQAQLTDYMEKCLAVKKQFPKNKKK